MRAAWIVEWHVHREDGPILDRRPHVLPHLWHSGRVLDFMRCLYWNSPLFSAHEALIGINRRSPEGILEVREGRRLMYGDATYLIAGYVTDLRIVKDDTGRISMFWTRPAGSRIDRESAAPLPLGSPVPRSYTFDEALA